MEPMDPIEWGRRQAARAPEWSDVKWRRIARILGVEFLPNAEHEADDTEGREQPHTGEAA